MVMSMTKNTAGYKFLKKFINLREKSPLLVTQTITGYLSKIKGVNVDIIKPNTESLIYKFFGSHSYIVHISYNNKLTKKILIGKGVCYDSGGYNIKQNMSTMHYDKNGALLSIAASLDTKTDCAVFFVNNLVLPGSVVSGEILMEPATGLKILIEDTDAEGRIGLADLLARFNYYDSVLTIATLTGAAVQVTGERTYALVHSNKPDDYHKLIDLYLKGLKLYPAPTHKEYNDSIDSKVKGADIINLPSYRGAGSSIAFSFLKRFWKGHQLHLDIAGMMLDKNHNGLVWGIEEVTELLKIL